MRFRETVGGALVENAGALFVSRVYTSALNFALLLLLMRRFSAGAVGAYYFLANLLNILATLLEFGTSIIAAREMARGRPEEEVLGDLLGLRTLFLAAGTALHVAVILLLEPDPGHRLLFLLAGLSLPGFFLGAAAPLFQARQRLVFPAAAVMAGETLFALVAIPAALSPAAEEARFRFLVYGTVASDILGGGLIFLWASRRVRLRPRFAPARIRALFREAAPQGLAAGAAILYFYIDTLMLKAMKGDHDAGIYNAAYRLLNFFVAPAGMVTAAAFPILVRALGTDLPRARELHSGVLKALVAVGLGPALLVAALSPEVLEAVYGRERAEYGGAAGALRALMLAGACVYPTAISASVLIAIGRQRVWTAIAGAGLAANAGLNLLLIPPLSWDGAALATLATEALVLALSLLAARRVSPIPGLPARAILGAAAAGAAGALAALAARPWGAGPALLLGAVLYVAGLSALGAFPREIFRLRA